MEIVDPDGAVVSKGVKKEGEGAAQGEAHHNEEKIIGESAREGALGNGTETGRAAQGESLHKNETGGAPSEEE